MSEQGYYLSLPPGWEENDFSDSANLSLYIGDRTAVFQVSAFEGEDFNSAEEMFSQYVSDLMPASQDCSFFYYNQYNAALADLSFAVDDSGTLMRGWFLFLDSDEKDYILLAFSSEYDYEGMFPFLLSCLDGFSPDAASRKLPGAVSQFFYPFPTERKKPETLYFNNEKLMVMADNAETEASQLVIEREARVLASYQGDEELFPTAWIRYYRLLFRDNYYRLEPIVVEMRQILDDNSEEEKALALMNWFQDFTYVRPEFFSDLSSPLDTVFSQGGDCDARVLAMAILLDHFGIKSVLMTSYVYSHAMIAVDIEGEGARFPHEDKEFLVMELTDDVDAGMIGSNVSGLENWIGVDFE